MSVLPPKCERIVHVLAQAGGGGGVVIGHGQAHDARRIMPQREEQHHQHGAVGGLVQGLLNGAMPQGCGNGLGVDGDQVAFHRRSLVISV